MRALDLINKGCFALCLAAVAIGTSFSIYAVWAGEAARHVGVRGLTTMAILIGAAFMIIVINNVVGRRVLGESSPLDFLDGGLSASPPEPATANPTVVRLRDRREHMHPGPDAHSSYEGETTDRDDT
ncbi:MAG: hypothetical protein AAFR38_00640 [Planctomycetota bacterium]